ncbi:ArsR family transcriptional regulator [Peribacillus deserti]|uniref:ArsR family transcriptional regulator n=1 Tax=Peribacillus deserti TaxID=673318 RepID=A0ABS2QLT6_9BACI|nr:metalloregulator ArsR/SmtB family transcription factor [Peribacillus deserti]MBM7694077.1 ArsR family transcriptional regulator [Peribacillus deserti]
MKKLYPNIETAASILKLLGDKTRLGIIKVISEQECCVCEFVELFQMTQPAVSQHLRKLKDGGLVKETRKGQWIFYSLNLSHPHMDWVHAIIREVPSQKQKLDELETQGKRICCD